MFGEQLLDIRDEVDRYGQRVEKAVADLGPTTGTDDSGTVTVLLARDGSFDVTVDKSWIARMQPDELAPAVLAAMADAGVRRTAAWVEELDRSEKTPPPVTRPLPDSDWAARLQEAVGGPIDERAMARVLGTFDDLDATIAELDERMTAFSQAEHEARSSGGHVTARCDVFGSVLALDYDLRWLRYANDRGIGRETTEACRRAHLAATEKSLQQLLADSRLGKLQALLTDPEEFARLLRESAAS